MKCVSPQTAPNEWKRNRSMPSGGEEAARQDWVQATRVESWEQLPPQMRRLPFGGNVLAHTGGNCYWRQEISFTISTTSSQGVLFSL